MKCFQVFLHIDIAICIKYLKTSSTCYKRVVKKWKEERKKKNGNVSDAINYSALCRDFCALKTLWEVFVFCMALCMAS